MHKDTNNSSMPLSAAVTQSERIASRRALLEMALRRQKPGSGSNLGELMKLRGPGMDWWSEVSHQLLKGGVPNAVTGALAANAYMPPRHTGGFDLAVAAPKLALANRILVDAGWECTGGLDLYEGLIGTSWKDSIDESRMIAVIGLPGAWGGEAMTRAQENAINGLPRLTLSFVVITKLVSSRLQDASGHQPRSGGCRSIGARPGSR